MSAAGDPQIEMEKEDTESNEETRYEVTLDDALKLAQAHHNNGNLAIADRTYRDILRAVPDHFPTVSLLAALQFQRGNLDEAIELGQKAVEVAPDNASCWSNFAATLSTAGQYDDALEAYDKAISLNPELFESYSNKSHTLWLLERFEEAEEVAAQATLLAPESVDAHINLGVALAAQNKLDEAEGVWKQIIEMDPDNARAYSNWCNALRHQARFEEAIEAGKKAIELNSNDFEAHNNLACVYKDMGDLDEAIKLFKKATDCKPDYHIAHNNLALTYLQQDLFDEALVAARYATSFKKDYAPAYASMSRAQSGLGKHDDARQSADRAITIDPEEPYYYLVLVDVLITIDRYDEGEAVLQQAIAMNPAEPHALIKLAEIRRNLDMLDDAIDALDKAIEISGATPPVLVQKARILEQASRVDDGLAVIEQALKLAPKNPWTILAKADLLLTVNRKDEAKVIMEENREHLERFPGFFVNLTAYKKFTKDDADFIKLKTITENGEQFSPTSRSNLHFALFKAYEDMGDYETAFDHLKTANDLCKQTHVFDQDAMALSFTRKKHLFTPAVLSQYEDKGYESDVPVFICGMPRSGTTLTEQIISSHPDVYGAGELYDLNSVIRELGPLTPENAAIMGQAYVEKAQKRDKSGKAKRITDKMPGNYNNIGLIHAILPHAKIIHCRRNPIDNCLSCYKQHFATGHYWTYDLEYLAQQHLLYQDLMQYWRETLPAGRFLEIDYEETVGDFENQARKLIDYVGLEWDNACLEPHKQKRAVLTASRDQVIKPVYTSSVEAWKRYEKQLEPLVKGLGL